MKNYQVKNKVTNVTTIMSQETFDKISVNPNMMIDSGQKEKIIVDGIEVLKKIMVTIFEKGFEVDENGMKKNSTESIAFKQMMLDEKTAKDAKKTI